MSDKSLSAKRVLMVIPPEDFRDEELFEPRSILEARGAKVVIAAKRLGTVTGMLGGAVRPDLLIADAEGADYDAIIVVGGSGSPTFLWNDGTLHELLRAAAAQERVIAAICLSGVVLARAGLLTGRRATVYKTRESLLEFERAGVRPTRDGLVVDGRLVTAVGPHVARQFGEAIADLLAA